MGVLISGGLASGGFPSLARLIVGTYGGNKAHLEPTGGIPSGRPAGQIPWVTSFSQMDNETATFCGFPNPTIPVPGLPELPAPSAISDCPTGMLQGAVGSKE